MEIYNRYIRHQPYADQAALVGGIGLYGAVQGYRYLRNQYNLRRNSLYGQALKGAFYSLKKNTMRGKYPLSPPRSPGRGQVRNVAVRARQARRNAVKAARKIARARYLQSYRTKGVGTTLSKSNKYIKNAMKPKKVMQMPKATGGAYAGGVGKTYKLRYNKEFGMLLRGAVLNKEYSGVTQTGTGQAVYVGHANYGFELLLKTFCRSLTKLLMMRVGVFFEQFTDSVLIGIVGNLIRIRYKGLYNPGAPGNFDHLIAAGTYENIAAAIYAHLKDQTSQYQMIDIQHIPGATSGGRYVDIHLKNAKIMVTSSSQFVIQNRTLAIADNQEQDLINNQPLRIKTYLGYGNGTQIAGLQSTAAEYVAGQSTGVIDVTPNTDNDQQEPPNAKFFASCYRSGSFVLDPGQSKKSSLYDSRVFGQTSFFAKVFHGAVQSFPTLLKLGKHKIFGVEKLIDCVEAQPDIAVGFEHNVKIGVVIKPGYNSYTAAYFDKQYK